MFVLSGQKRGQQEERIIKFQPFPLRIGVNSTFSQWASGCDRLCSGVNLPFSATSTAWPTFTETDNNRKREYCGIKSKQGNLISGYAYSSPKSPWTITHITGGRGGFLSGMCCLNNTSIVIFAILWTKRFGGRVKIFQSFQNLFFMSPVAFWENCYGGTLHFSGTQKCSKYFGSPGVKLQLHTKK